MNVLILSNYHDLFSECYIENNDIDGQETTDQDLKILKELDSEEVFENIKDIFKSLLEFKKIAKNTKQSQDEDFLKEYNQTLSNLKEENKNLAFEVKILSDELEVCKEKILKLEKEKQELQEKF